MELLLVVAAFAGCGFFPDIEKPPLLSLFAPGNGHNRVGIVSSDLGSAGRFTLMTPEGLPLPAAVSVHSDAKAVYQNGKVYIINRLNRDNIQVLDPELAYLTVLEFSTGTASNPQDIALLDPGLAAVALYERSVLAFYDPRSGSPRGELSLGGYPDPDGLPETASLFAQDDRLFVAIQRLDRTAVGLTAPPSGTSYLLEIDRSSLTIVNAHPFPASNPFSRLKRVEVFGAPHLISANPGFLGVNFQLDGGVVAFNLNTRSFRPGLVYAETTAGGDILDVVIKNEAVGYALVQLQDLSTQLQRFDPSTGARIRIINSAPAVSGFTAGLLIGPNGYLYAAESSLSNPGVVIYDTNRGDARLTPVPVSVGLRPTDLIFIP